MPPEHEAANVVRETVLQRQAMLSVAPLTCRLAAEMRQALKAKTSLTPASKWSPRPAEKPKNSTS